MTKTILYIEDNPLNMRLVRKILGTVGYSMIEAIDGISGIASIEDSRPDLILMDVNLPDIDGLEVTRKVKAIPHLSHIPIIALTANAMYGDRERCLAAGCDGYVAKPVARRELINVVQHFLGNDSSQYNNTYMKAQ
jgi:two-component system, cell cycle response regulator DivK